MKSVIEDTSKCTGCQACFNVCAKNAIEMKYDGEGFLFPQIDESKCVNCHLCQKVCPAVNTQKNKKYRASYGCFASDEKEQMESSSGGFFALLAKKIISEGGIVYGAAFDEKFNVVHASAENETELKRLRETKYVQSSTGQSFKDALKNLKAGRKVLFSGTPCQIAGLKGYLTDDYDNLICLDLICHGAASPKVWQSYVAEKIGTDVAAISFRDKSKGIHNVYLTYKANNGGEYREKYTESKYIEGFAGGMFIRESCFICKYVGYKRCSDITIGDFWGTTEHPGFSNNFGSSVVVLHNKKAQRYFDSISDEMKIVKTTRYNAALWNKNMLEPTLRSDAKEIFYNNWQGKSVSEAVDIASRTYTEPVCEEKESMIKTILRKLY